MTKSGTTQLWIKAGYTLFAYEGSDGIQVEKLARYLGRNKSGFYYHFGDRELFFTDLIQYHNQIIDQFCQAVSKSQHFMPDYLRILVEYRESVFVQMHMRRNMQNPFFRDTFNRVISKTDHVVIPLWSAFIGIPKNHILAQDLWNILRDVFFTRINTDNLSYEFLHSLVNEFSHVVAKLKHMAQIPDTTQ